MPGVLLETSVEPLLDKFRTKGWELSPKFQFWDHYLMNTSKPFKLFMNSSRHAEWEVNKFSYLIKHIFMTSSFQFYEGNQRIVSYENRMGHF